MCDFRYKKLFFFLFSVCWLKTKCCSLLLAKLKSRSRDSRRPNRKMLNCISLWFWNDDENEVWRKNKKTKKLKRNKNRMLFLVCVYVFVLVHRFWFFGLSLSFAHTHNYSLSLNNQHNLFNVFIIRSSQEILT